MVVVSIVSAIATVIVTVTVTALVAMLVIMVRLVMLSRKGVLADPLSMHQHLVHQTRPLLQGNISLTYDRVRLYWTHKHLAPTLICTLNRDRRPREERSPDCEQNVLVNSDILEMLNALTREWGV